MKARFRIGLAALVVVAAMGMVTGCDSLAAIFGYVPDGTVPDGYVPVTDIPITVSTLTGVVSDARLSAATAAIAGVTVTLTAAGSTATAPTALTAADGVFSFTDVATGVYTLSASKVGYAFIDKTVEATQMNATIDAGSLLGFSSVGNKISLIVVWSAAFGDVDTHFTIPVNDKWNSLSNPVLADPYDMPTAGIQAGFLPTTTTGREDIYFGHKNSAVLDNAYLGGTSTGSAVTLDRDVLSGPGPETITIHALPMPAAVGSYSYNITGSPTGNGLPTDSSNLYAWVGVAEYYVKAYSSTATLSTEGVSGGAAAEVYVVQGSSIKGRFTVPDYMAIDQASVVRVNMFLKAVSGGGDVPVYQFVPDIRIADYAGMRNAATDDNASIVLYGNPRN